MRRRNRAWQRSDAEAYATCWLHFEGCEQPSQTSRRPSRKQLPELNRWTPPDGWDRRSLPSEMEALIAEATRWIQAFEDCGRRLVPQCVAADFTEVARVLLAIREAGWLPGCKFLELGSGYGIVTMLASMIGFDAVGVEASDSLVHRSREFARSRSIAAEFIVGDFVPLNFSAVGADRVSPTLSHRGHSDGDECPIDWDDHALLYSYPWPGEHELHERMVRQYARPGAGYIQFRGPADLAIFSVGHTLR